LTVKICVSILPSRIKEAVELITKAEKYKPDFIEVRLDLLKEDNSLGEIAEHADVPLIAANRAQNCGGKFSGDENQRLRIILNAARNGFEYADIELSSQKLKDTVTELRQVNVKPIISFHDFNETPSTPKLRQILKKEIAEGAEICKIVTKATKIGDNLTVLNFLLDSSKNAKLVCFAMGPLGKPSRLLSPLFGGFFTIASLETSRETASGQVTIKDLRTAYQALGVI